ncbi:MAG TPA: ABC transporter permease subunit [Paenibacillaceae bacterium]
MRIDRALWKREYDQAKWIVWMTPLAHFLALGGNRLNDWYLDRPENIQDRLARVHSHLDAYEYGEMELMARISLMIVLFVLALVQIGAERRNGGQEFLFSLPCSRARIFWTKWLFGTVLLTGSLVLNTALDMAIVMGSPIAEHFRLWYHLDQFFFAWLSLAAVYSMFLFVGTISGSLASQAVFALLAPVLPYLIALLVQIGISIHNDSVFRFPEADYVLLFPVRYDYPDILAAGPFPWIFMAAVFAAASAGGMIAYRRTRAENNGKLVVFPLWECILQAGFVFCSALAGGTFTYAFFNASSVILYYVGLALGAAISAWVIRRLLRLRLKI